MKNEAIGGVHWSFWAICAVTLIYIFAGVINFFFQINVDTVAAMSELHRATIEGRPFWATGSIAVAVFGGVLGCFLLLFRRLAAYYVFIISLFGSIVTMTHTLGVAGSGLSPVDFVIGNLELLGVTAFLIWYSKQAERKGWIS